MQLFPQGKKEWLRLVTILACLVIFVGSALFYMTSMPGKSFAGPLPPLSTGEVVLAGNLRKTVTYLAGNIGERNIIAYPQLQATATFIESWFKSLGYEVKSQEYVVQMRKVSNISVEIPGSTKPKEIIVVGAHYDTVYDCPGADDNTSGIAALLELARLLRESHPARTIRFVAFVNEEPPWFQTESMGSLVYAREAHHKHENIVAAISLETVGMYSDRPGSQQYPEPMGVLYPDRGNFIGFVGNLSSRRLVRETIRIFRQTVTIPSEGSAAPEFFSGVGWSDHWSFWQEGYPAIMVTDTAPFRNPNYHRPTDKPDTLDYDRMARVVGGLRQVVLSLANSGQSF
ncbi:MAG TPA: M20/M25/M40 family metallo-hydrolase [Candidatus Angelobacter sp.]|nr:M20/M25/M40 family metallo-hydrolase [Candidatus Angelobacter sp.]